MGANSDWKSTGRGANHRRSQDIKLKEGSTETMLKRTQAYLSREQVHGLLDVMNSPIDIHGRGNFPTLRLTLSSLIQRVLHRLQERGMNVNQMKMNGGAASCILASRDLHYTDIDLIFDGVDLSKSKNFELIKDAVLEALIDFLPSCTNKSKITPISMKEAYVKKMVKVRNDDLWSLISLNNDLGRFIELKFVHRMRRQFEFSVDSFQIHLDSVLALNQMESTGEQQGDQKQPKVLAESMYGDFLVALRHLNKMLIDTTEPELIRGGGLLKYCQLLAQGYRPARIGQCRNLEPYMCSRFFIDFPTVIEQQKKLLNYLDNHFRGDTKAKYDYLLLLYGIVDESTVCLMNHDRQLTLTMIDSMACQLNARMYYEEQRKRALMAAKTLSSQITASDSNSTRSTTPTGTADRSGSVEEETCLVDQQQHGRIMTDDGCQQGQQQRPKQTLLYVPPNASYWIKVV